MKSFVLGAPYVAGVEPGGGLGGAAVMAKQVDVGAIGSYFESLSDPRHTRNRKHLLVDVAVVAVCGVLCGCDGPTAMHRWAVLRHEWLKRHLALPNGIPSRDCIRRLLMALKPEAFQRCFQAWLADVQDAGSDADVKPSERLVAIDGKTCRGSKDPAKGLGALHVVSAWASEEGIALGQVATAEKSNEITAIPQLLDQIQLPGTLVTIDAMGCQKEIVAKIVEGGGDCVIAVKENQPKLLEAVRQALFDDLEREREELQYRVHETVSAGHGRIDERSYLLTKTPRDFAAASEWPWIKAVGYAVRITTRPDGTTSDEVRYYISTRDVGPKRFGEAVRGHWSIEAMHWVLDVVFREDDRRTRERVLADNLSWLRRFAVSLLKRHPVNDSIRGKMLACGYNIDYLTQVLAIQ